MNLKNAIPRIQMNLIHEYTQNANPYMTPVPPDIFPPTLYEDCSISTIIPLGHAFAAEHGLSGNRTKFIVLRNARLTCFMLSKGRV